MQERIVTAKTRGVVEHLDEIKYFINFHALHNANLIREALPQSIIQPQPRFPDRRKKHDELAASLRITGPAKRAATAAKTADTRTRKKQQENRETPVVFPGARSPRDRDPVPNFGRGSPTWPVQKLSADHFIPSFPALVPIPPLSNSRFGHCR